MDTLLCLTESEVVYGDGARLYMDDGAVLIDMFTDTGTASLGYGGIELQCGTLDMLRAPIHTPNLLPTVNRSLAARMICELTGMDRVFFANTGSEAVEAAIKLCRKYQYDKDLKRKTVVYTYSGGFHGRTYGSLAASDGPSYHFEGFGPMPTGYGKFREICDIDFSRAAMVMIAPVFGNHDVVEYDLDWLEELRDLCRRTRTLLVFDEIQTGAGRTGSVTYAQKIGVTPDVLVLGKGIGMGCPASAVLSNEEVGKTFTPGSHFSTFGGNMISVTYMLRMMEWLSDKRHIDGIEFRGRIIEDFLQRQDWVVGVRRVGMMIAADVDFDAIEFARRCLVCGLLLGVWRHNPVKITPPLNIDIRLLRDALDIMKRVAKTMER
jgi:acetylornithine/N-succinyldiaminopimelate aminotransferase